VGRSGMIIVGMVIQEVAEGEMELHGGTKVLEERQPKRGQILH